MNRSKCIFMSQQFFFHSAAFPPINAHTIFYFLFSSIPKPLSHSQNVQTHRSNTFISVLNVATTRDALFRCRTMESAEKNIINYVQISAQNNFSFFDKSLKFWNSLISIKRYFFWTATFSSSHAQILMMQLGRSFSLKSRNDTWEIAKIVRSCTRP